MGNNWKKIWNKAKDSTADALDKGREIVSIQSHKNAINAYSQEIGKIVYVYHEKGYLASSIEDVKVKSLLEDIDYKMKKIEELSKE